jgi:hypothetical protein
MVKIDWAQGGTAQRVNRTAQRVNPRNALTMASALETARRPDV